MIAVHRRAPQRSLCYAPSGLLDCLLLSEADLIVRVGDGGVQAQRSVGQPYFLTLPHWVRGDGGQHVKLDLIPGFPSLLSCIFIGAPGATTSGNSEKG